MCDGHIALDAPGPLVKTPARQNDSETVHSLVRVAGTNLVCLADQGFGCG